MRGIAAYIRRRRVFRVTQYALLGAAAVWISFPIYWLVATSLKPADEILARTLSDFVPSEITWDHFFRVIRSDQLLTYLTNSALVAGGTTLVTLVVSSTGGYALARLEFPGSRWLGRVILFTYIVPPVLLVIPIFEIVFNLGLHDTRTGLMIAHITFSLPFSLWLLRGYFASLPGELEESAMVAGASRLGALWRVVLPLAAPGLVAAAMFTFILSWNEYLYALVLLTSEDVRTLPVGVATSFMNVNMFAGDWAVLMAASVVSAVPVFLVFLVLQRWLVSGLAAGAVKG